MGLDVYLYHCPDRTTAKAAEEQYEKQSEENWKVVGNFDKSSEKQKEEVRKKNIELAKSLGCTGQYEAYHTVTKIEEDSKLFPEHMFKIGYFRSSYNSGGINSYLKQFGIPDLYDIFKKGEKEYEFTPEWEKSLKIATEAISLYREHLFGEAGGLRTIEIRGNIFSQNTGPKSAKEAMDLVKEEIKRKSGGCYSNANGEFYFDEPLECVGFMMGTHSLMKKDSPCCYIVYRVREPGKVAEVEEKLDKKEGDFYLQSLMIVKETIEWVLSKPDPQNYYFHWSS